MFNLRTLFFKIGVLRDISALSFYRTFHESSTGNNVGTIQSKNVGSYPHNIYKLTSIEPITIAVSSRAIFSITDENESETVHDRPADHKSSQNMDTMLMNPGTAFHFIKVLQNVNNRYKELDTNCGKDDDLFNILLISQGSADIGMKIIKSIDAFGLKIKQMCLTNGADPVQYLKAYDTSLFLTSNVEEARLALHNGVPSGCVYDQVIEEPNCDQLRVVFDCDCVLFSEESDQIYQNEGLDAWVKYEHERKETPMKDGPLKKFAVALGNVQKLFADVGVPYDSSPIRTYVVTARQVCEGPGQRALQTLHSWGVHINEMNFLSGKPKYNIIKVIKPHIFFDDSDHHIEGGRSVGVPSAKVH